MIKKYVLMILLGFILNAAYSQYDCVLPDPSKPDGTFTDWIKETATFDDGTKITYEYRICFVKKNAMACNYIIEVKNTSNVAATFKVDYRYDDKLVKKTFYEIVEGKVKPGGVLEGKVIQQGCKREKGVQNSDLEACIGCNFGYKIRVFIKS